MNVKKIDVAMGYKIRVCLIAVAVCVVLATVWAVVAVPGTALANPPDADGNHSHGGGDDGGATSLYFDVLLVLGVDAAGNPDGDADDIFMVCGSGIDGSIGGAGVSNIVRLIVHDPPPHMDITSVIDQLIDQPVESCFGDIREVDEEGNVSYVVGRHGILHVVLPDRNGNEMLVGFSVEGTNTKGRIVGYRINTTGTLVDLDGDGSEWGGVSEWAAVQDAVYDGTADPDADTIPNFFVQVGAAQWTLFKSDGSQKFACSGDGTFANGFGISITRARLDQENTLLCP